MNSRLIAVLAGVLAVVILATSCSGSGSTGEQASRCAASANEIIERFDNFVEPLGDLAPEEFFADPDIDGLEAFQNDVAATVIRVATDPNDDCTERDLEREVDQALQRYAGQGVLQQYLVGSVQQGLSVETRDIVVTPDDDLLAVLPLLGPGSSVTFTEGTFELAGTLLVQTELTIIGAGRGETVLNSTAEAAAIAVLDEGRLVMNDITVRHQGDLPASVLITFDAPVELVGVGISGAIADGEGAGGSGIVLTGPTNADGAETAASATITIDDSFIANNAAAGIAVTGALAPVVLNSTISSNGQCGICYFDAAGGTVQSNTFEENQVGIQASDNTRVEVTKNGFFDNVAAGILVEGLANPMVLGNTFRGEDIVGIDVQDAATPTISLNEFGPHAVAISVRGDSVATVDDNTVDGGDVGLLVGGSAAPIVHRNEIRQTNIAGILHTNESKGEFVANRLLPGDGAGVVLEESAAPTYNELLVQGGVVGMAFTQQSKGSVTNATFNEQAVGIEVSDDAAPSIVESEFVTIAQAGVLFTGQGAPELRGSAFTMPAEIAIQAGGSAAPVIEGNTVEGGDTAILIIEDSRAVITGNRLNDQLFGIGVSGSANPTIENNTISGASSGALSFDEDATGEAKNNTVTDAGVVGIRIGGDAAPRLEGNDIFARVDLPTEDAELIASEAAELAVLRAETEAALAQSALVIAGDEVRLAEAALVAAEESGDALAIADAKEVLAQAESAVADAEAAAQEAEENAAAAVALVDAAESAATEAELAISLSELELMQAELAVAEAEAAVETAAVSEDAGEQGEAQIALVAARANRAAAEAARDEAQALTAEAEELAAQVEELIDQAETQDGAPDIEAGEQSGAGLLYVDRGQGKAVDNSVFGFVIGVQVSDQATPSLETNRIDGAGVGGVGFLYGAAAAGEAIGNEALNHQLGFQISGSATPKLTNNRVEAIAVAGFFIQGSATPVLSGSDCGSVQPGIVLLEQAAPDLNDNNCSVS